MAACPDWTGGGCPYSALILGREDVVVLAHLDQSLVAGLASQLDRVLTKRPIAYRRQGCQHAASFLLSSLSPPNHNLAIPGTDREHEGIRTSEVAWKGKLS